MECELCRVYTLSSSRWRLLLLGLPESLSLNGGDLECERCFRLRCEFEPALFSSLSLSLLDRLLRFSQRSELSSRRRDDPINLLSRSASVASFALALLSILSSSSFLARASCAVSAWARRIALLCSSVLRMMAERNRLFARGSRSSGLQNQNELSVT